MSWKRFPSPLDQADAVHFGRFDWVPTKRSACSDVRPNLTSYQPWFRCLAGEFSGPLSNCGLVCNKTAIFSLCVFEWSYCFLWLLKLISLLFCFLLTILNQGHFQEISWSQLPAGSLSPPSPGVFTTSRSLPEGEMTSRALWYIFHGRHICISNKP